MREGSRSGGGEEGGMMTREELLRLKRAVWLADAVRPPRVYAVLDCARDPAIYDLVTRSYREKSCLFAGKLHPELEMASPFLLEVQAADSITDQILQRGWTKAWGILIRTDASFRTVRRHLRTLLRVRTEDGRFLLFRFYDPRTLNVYLPTCTPQELALMFGEDASTWFSFSGGLRETNAFTFEEGELRYSGFPLRESLSLSPAAEVATAHGAAPLYQAADGTA